MRYLVRMIDDATSWRWGRFVEPDAPSSNLAVLWEYLDKNGRMGEVYTDRDSMFAVPPRPPKKRTHFLSGHALNLLARPPPLAKQI